MVAVKFAESTLSKKVFANVTTSAEKAKKMLRTMFPGRLRPSRTEAIIEVVKKMVVKIMELLLENLIRITPKSWNFFRCFGLVKIVT